MNPAVPGGPFRAHSGGGKLPRVNPGLSYFGHFGPRIGWPRTLRIGANRSWCQKVGSGLPGDTDRRMGVSAYRRIGVSPQSHPFLLFLDADEPPYAPTPIRVPWRRYADTPTLRYVFPTASVCVETPDSEAYRTRDSSRCIPWKAFPGSSPSSNIRRTFRSRSSLFRD